MPAGPSGQAAAVVPVSRENRIAFLKKAVVPVRSIDLDDQDFSDLEPLRRLIGDRRVVLLGETTHADGATFAAKARLIRFLYERMGFDVLAFEGGFYDVRKVWTFLRNGEDPLSSVRSGLFVDWTDSGQTQSLWRYLAERSKTDRPLEVAGFDLQFTGGASREHLVKDLNDYLLKAGVTAETADIAARVSYVLRHLTNNLILFQKIGPEERTSVRKAVADLGRALQGIPNLSGNEAVERDYWFQLLKSSAAMMELAWNIDLEARAPGSAGADTFNRRDRQMGENFVWLAKHAFPTRKIVAWSAMSHVIRNRDSVLEGPLVSMGDWIDKAMGSEVYTLGFTAYQGRFGKPGAALPFEIKPADEGSLEDLMFRADFTYAWLDFRNLPTDGRWLQGPLSSRTIGYQFKTADWTKIMDGIFFIREMTPSAPLAK